VDGQRRFLSLLGRGLTTGVVSMTLTAAVAFTFGLLVWSAPCHAPERGCISGLAAVGLIVMVAPVMLAVVGPLVARRLRFSWPGYLWFAAPAGWLVLWICAGIRSERWPFMSVTANVVVLLILYCLAAWLASRSSR
jgi:hypothetical protein